MSIYIGNLSYEVTDEQLREVFADYGTVKEVSMPRDRETGKLRGFAFVTLETEAEEAEAIEELNEAEWMGRTLRVNKARPKERSGGDRRTRRYKSF